MSLASGTRLGVYEIISALGAGGMGEVYRARDSKLKRDVALKVLPVAVAGDPDRLARFQREAEVLASLNHPHIAQIYGVEDSDGTSAIVMELVEGDDLAQRIALGPIALDEALAIARQIAEALEAAHDVGIVHRDLKPANVKVRADGTVKVLDFGLAKALDTGAAGTHSLANSPTLTSPAQLRGGHATAVGVILGTAAYMAPEQARGRPVDRRADIWAFGCVLYEMLTGQKAFDGDDVTDLIAAIVTKDPDWTRLPAPVPPFIRVLLRRCLEKNVQKRLPHIGLVRLELETPPADMPPPALPARDSTGVGLVTIAGMAAALALGAAATYWWTSRPGAPAAPGYRSTLVLPMAANVEVSPPSNRFAIAPDGTSIAYVADHAASQGLWLWRLSDLEPQAVARTRNAVAPFWSPDSRSVAFFMDGQLMKVDVAGGQPTPIGSGELFRQRAQTPGSWSRHGVILFSARGILNRVAAAGGAAEPLTTLDPATGEDRHLFPHVLPDGEHFLYTAYQGLTALAVYTASLADPASRVKLIADGSNAQYANGFLLSHRNDALVAQPFDPVRRVLSGNATPIADRVLFNVAFPYAGAFSASQTGVLVHQDLAPGRASSESDEVRLVWRSRDGAEQVLLDKRGAFRQSAISPDGRRAVMSLFDAEGSSSLWTLDLGRGVRSRLTFGRRENAAVWLDNRSIIFNSSSKTGQLDLYVKTLDPASAETVILSDGQPKTPMSVSADGRFLLYAVVGSQTVNDIWVMALDGSSKPRPLLATVFEERWPQFSPDGRWIAYMSDESGSRQVYVRAFPGGDAQIQVSTDGGDYPRWSRDGDELFFYHAGQVKVAVVKRQSDSLEVASVSPLFDYRLPLGFGRQFFDVTPDRRFLMMSTPPPIGPTTLTLTVNWPALLPTAR